MKKQKASKPRTSKPRKASATDTDVQTEQAVAQRNRVGRLYGHDPGVGNEKPLASESAPAVGSEQMADMATDSMKGRMTMATLQLKGLSKSGKYALYSGLRTVSRLSVTNFPDPENPPQTLEMQGDLAGPRVKMTPEERKAARANAPKPTLAERIAASEKKLAKMREKLATAEAQGQPVGV